MGPSGRGQALQSLREEVHRLERAGPGGRARREALPFGLPDLDRRLPGGGLPLGALHEVSVGRPGPEHEAAAILFAAGILARLKGPVLWCLASRDLFAPALARAGLHPDRVVYAETWRDAELLPVMEEGVRSPAFAGVVGEVGRLSLAASRRLQLAAEVSGSLALAVRRRAGAGGEGVASATRWQVSALPSSPMSTTGIGRARWRVELLRCRGAPAGTDETRWVLEACDEAGRLRAPPDLADRPRPEAAGRAAAG